MADPPVRIAVVGAGAIGRSHADRVAAEAGASLAAIVDPAAAGSALAAAHRVPWFADLSAFLAQDRPDAVIIATPNPMHVPHGLQAVAAGLPALVEKPLADDVAAAARLVEAAERAGVPLLTGHHRRHNPIARAAKQTLEAGTIGPIVAAHTTCWFHKPARYFEPQWRRETGAGPVLINLIHDLDLLRWFCGEVDEVQAMLSHRRRGLPVEDTAVILLRFANGALGTVSVSDTIAAPWSWELTSGENPAYSQTTESCTMLGGVMGSLSIPQLDLWQHETAPDWWQPIRRARLPADTADPLALQVRNLCAVVRGAAAPVVSGRDGLAALRIAAAVSQAAATGRPARVAPG